MILKYNLICVFKYNAGAVFGTQAQVSDYRTPFYSFKYNYIKNLK